MKKLLALSLIAIGALSIYAKDIKEYVVTTQPPMSCQNCENRIKGNLRFEKGVKKIETDLEHQRVTVTYDADKTNEANLEQAFGKLDYKVTKIEGNDSTSCAQKKHECKGGACQGKGNGDCQGKTECDEGSGCCKKK